jgi:2'-5' RNA ligase
MSFTEPAAAALTRAGYAVTDSQSGSDGIIVALAVPPQDAAHLAIHGGENPQELHVTLAYLGKCSDLTDKDADLLTELVRRLSEDAGGLGPLNLHISGAGTFPNAGDNDTDASYLDVSGAGLHELREKVMRLCEEAGLPASTKHPEFHPHITLAYTPHGQPHPARNPPATRLIIPDVQVWFGGQHASIPFASTFAKAAQPPAPALGKAREMYAQLTGDLIQVHRQTRQAKTQTDAVRAHHDQAAQKLGDAIRAPRGSALEDAYLDHAEEARTARTLTDL